MSYPRLLLFCIVLTFALCSACTREEAPAHLQRPVPAVGRKNHSNGSVIRIVLGGMITPKEGLAYYRELLDFVGVQIGCSVEYVDADNYKEINDKLETGELDAGFVCSGPYVSGKEKFHLELLAIP